MTRLRNERNAKNLWGLIFVAIIVWVIFHVWPRITGSPEVDGLLAAFLGFYICSRAAANFLNVLIYELDTRRWASMTRPDLAWLGLNALVMLTGLMLVVTGIYRFFSRVF